MMDCQGVSERLPWLVAGSLSADEADEVRAHLSTCPRCREELAETRHAAAVFGAHLATSLILDLAWERPVAGPDSSLAASHLQSCADCREELDLARESRLLETRDVEPSTGARWKRTLIWLVPASLAAGLVAGFGVGTRRTPVPAREAPRVAELERESARLRSLVEKLETAARTARPRINLPLFELMPGVVRRGGAEEATEVAIPAGADEIVLLLGTERPAGARASLAITDAAGREVWTADGLVSGPPGGYVVTVPTEMLPAGSYSIRLQPQRGAGVDYRIRVRR